MPSYSVFENEWIVLTDGARLAARVWMPEGPGPFPAVLEYLPYRKRNGTSARDESTYPVFAEAGIAGVRVDIRGSGESDGVIDGEYTERELSDGCEIVAWIAKQDWSNGKVGMMGISWGGFNALQIAALNPQALKAVISIASTVDRYNDDIHYKNGCHLSAQLSWAATMLAYQSRSPDPAIVGDRWREMWLERINNEPFFMEEWLNHQRLDEFWKHGSICEDFDGFKVPALVIAGWADGYRNTPFKAVQGVGNHAKGVIGPWIHKYPHFAWPRPRWDFHAEAIAWWRKWLCDEDTGTDAAPQMRAYILDGPAPALRREYDRGYWVAIPQWRQPTMRTFGVNGSGRLAEGSGPGVGVILVQSPLDTGTAAGEWFTLKPDAEMAGDQRGDDAGSLTFQTAPLEEELILLGLPRIKVDLSSNEVCGNLIVRLVDVHPDGAATRVSLGILNLAHRNSNETPTPMPIGQPVRIELDLDACGYRLAPGHCLRLAISTAYWPTVLPPPRNAALTVDTDSLALELPMLGDHQRIEMPEPANPDPLPRHVDHTPSVSKRIVERDLNAGVTIYKIHEDTGLSEHPQNGLIAQDVRSEEWSITNSDVLSMRGQTHWRNVLQRGDWNTTTVSSTTISCSDTEWIVSADVSAFENDVEIASRSYAFTVRRDFM